MDEMTGIKKAEMKMTRSYSIDMIIILAACAAVGTTLYGARLLLTVFVSLATALLTETAASYIFRRSKPEMIGDLSDVVTGLIIALILPVSAPVWMAAAGSFFAVACIKLPFGDAVTTPFVPAAAGGAFLSLCFKEFFFTYPSVNIGNKYAMTGTSGFVSGTSVAQMLDASRSIGTTVIDVFDIFVGRVPGPAGATCLFVMIGGFLYLLMRRPKEWIVSAAFIATCSIMAVLFPRVLSGRSVSLLMEISSGLLFFSAVILLPDPATAPKSQTGKVIYGFAAAVLTMLFRYFGGYEDGVLFVVLMMNAVSVPVDRLGNSIEQKLAAKRSDEEEASV
jgi:electron transport complex protein RnfD